MATITLIEQDDVERDYGFSGVEAVIDHPAHGRILLCDGYGEDAHGAGCVRWGHGKAISLQPTDDLDTLRADPEAWMALLHGYDSSRPVLEWTGHMVASVAKSAGLH